MTVLDFGTGVDKAAEARFNQANNDGELPCGRKIQYIPSLDDQGTPDLDLTDIRRLTQQDGVFAIAPALSPAIRVRWHLCEPAPGSHRGLGGLPRRFASLPTRPTCISSAVPGCLNPARSNHQSNVLAGSMAKLFQLKGSSAQGSSVALIGDDTDTSKAGNAGIGGQLQAVGFKIVYSQNPMPAAPGRHRLHPICRSHHDLQRWSPARLGLRHIWAGQRLRTIQSLTASGVQGHYQPFHLCPPTGGSSKGGHGAEHLRHH